MIAVGAIPARHGGRGSPPATQRGDTGSLTPQEREKATSVREELENQQKGIRFLTPGTDLWRKVSEEIGRLEACLRQREEAG